MTPMHWRHILRMTGIFIPICDGEDAEEFKIKSPSCYILALGSMGFEGYHIKLT